MSARGRASRLVSSIAPRAARPATRVPAQTRAPVPPPRLHNGLFEPLKRSPGEGFQEGRSAACPGGIFRTEERKLRELALVVRRGVVAVMEQVRVELEHLDAVVRHPGLVQHPAFRRRFPFACSRRPKADFAVRVPSSMADPIPAQTRRR